MGSYLKSIIISILLLTSVANSFVEIKGKVFLPGYETPIITDCTYITGHELNVYLNTSVYKESSVYVLVWNGNIKSSILLETSTIIDPVALEWKHLRQIFEFKGINPSGPVTNKDIWRVRPFFFKYLI